MISARAKRFAGRTADEAVARLVRPSRVAGRFADVPGVSVRQIAIPTTLDDTPARTAGLPHEILARPLPAPAHRVMVAEVPDGRLMIDGAVTVDRGLVRESLWDQEHYDRSYARASRSPRPQRVEGTVASLLSLWATNHYHWVLDVLPRLATLEAAGLDDLPVAVPERINRAQAESLDLLGITSDRRIPTRGNLAPDRLVWASSPSYIMHTTPYTAAWLRKRFTAEPRSTPSRRLYIRRGVSRRVANEDAVLAVLDAHGFEVLAAEKLTFAQQVAAFAAAEAVVAPHGAGLVGLAFGTGTKVLELFAPDYVNPCFRVLASAAGHDYRYLVGRTSGPAVQQGGDIEVPLDLLRASLARMWEAPPVPDVRRVEERNVTGDRR